MMSEVVLGGISCVWLLMELTCYDGHNHVYHCVDAHIKCPRKPHFAIQSLCHDSDLKDWLLDMDFKKDDNHGLGAHPKVQLSENFLERVTAKIHMF